MVHGVTISDHARAVERAIQEQLDANASREQTLAGLLALVDAYGDKRERLGRCRSSFLSTSDDIATATDMATAYRDGIERRLRQVLDSPA